MRKVKHVLLDERLFYLFVGPVDEKFVVEISFLCKATREIDRVLQSSAIPVCFEKDA